MMTLTADAQQLFDRYLQTVRWSVRGVADADEIERDVREHVATALTEKAEPVTAETLREVLSRLGDPWQWIPAEELPFWRRSLMRLWLGPEDWRLAYACFGLTLLGIVLLPVGIGALLLIAAYLLARATCEVAVDRDGSLGARRWLVYPPIVAFCLFGFGFLLIAPAVPAIAWGAEHRGFLNVFDHSHFRLTDDIQVGIFIVACSAIVFGTWWIALSGIFAAAAGPVRVVFAPLANGFRRVHALWLTTLGVLAVGGGAAALLLF